MSMNTADWHTELKLHDELFTTLAAGLPSELIAVKNKMNQALQG
jgi:phosphoenolpyruvate carboxykinase (GTP)